MRKRVRVADAAHISDALDASAADGDSVAELLAQVADVHIDAPVEGVELPSKHRFDQFLARDHASGGLQQQRQQLEFDDSQLDRLSAAIYAVSSSVQFDI